MIKAALKKVPGDIKGVTLMALIYFLYTIFDSRYALKAEVSNIALDLGIFKAKMVSVDERTKRIEAKLDHYMEKRHD